MKERDLEWADLMRAANAGDEAAYARLLKGLAIELRAFVRGALARSNSAVDVEDIVQETLIAIHLKRHTWIDTEPFGPWMRAIARHKFIDAMRRIGRRVHVPIEDFENLLSAEEANPDTPRSDVEKHLPQLPDRQRGVVQSIALDGRSISETAKQFAMSEGAVRVALHRGVKTLAGVMRGAV
ncbi:sigma-70 family RNA polymerase sigma factor [Variibacter gotjawalensis]|uniref:sigma-70 family RNA polymerase sigma factor n=2 Tax=Variibacter gotjawalensis TaxID=1333996 RepID=UPI000BBAE713|nr:sigma-70 family RNA polymerase sigma factor [Variibacter gotjawalensis]